MHRTLVIVVVAVALVAGAGGILYAFGTPQAPEPAITAGPEPAGTPAVEIPVKQPTRQQDGEVSGDQTGESMADVPKPAPGTKAPAADPDSPFHVQIPGCVCHSDDPAIVEEHAKYRMNQCAGCHSGGTPTGRE